MDEDPRDLLKPFPAELMTMWPINRKVGSPKNDTADILDHEEPIRVQDLRILKPSVDTARQ